MTARRSKHALALSAILLLLATACSPSKEHPDGVASDLCAMPKPTPAQSLANVQKGGVDNATQADVDSMNADMSLQDCLTLRAFLARNLSGSLEDVRKAVVAQCYMSFGAAEYAKRELPSASKDPGERIEDRAFDESEEAREALAQVVSYRECAQGIRQP